MNKQKQFNITIILFIAVAGFLFSCEKKSENSLVYDPSKPVQIDGFEPDSGGMATKVFIYGNNFGTDLSKIKVYYNTMRAPVIGSDGDHIYVITPRQPGAECVLSVVVGTDSAVYAGKKFLYHTMATVTTIAGKKGTTEFHGGTLSEATFEYPCTLCVDAEGNIFLSHWRTPYCFVLISQEKNIVEALYTGDPLGAPTADVQGKVIMAPTDGGDGYYYFDPDAQWSPKMRLILHPTTDMIAAGMKDFSIDYKHGMTACFQDGYIYTRSYAGQIIRFDPVTRIGEQVAAGIQPNDNSYPFFDPYKPNIMYIAYPTRNAIYTFDVNTGEHTLFAGSPGEAGWKDGNRLEAEFNGPSQIVVDQTGTIFVADRYNHCIRRITPDGMVSTVIGKGGVAGYQDGNPEDALFDEPLGVAIDKDGNIYVAEWGNNVVRKLAVE